MQGQGRVVHCKKEAYDTYIGRPSKWGNPFMIGRDGDREAVIRKYEAWLVGQPHLMEALLDLHGQTLGCWCAPAACHGDVLLRLAAGQAQAYLADLVQHEKQHLDEV